MTQVIKSVADTMPAVDAMLRAVRLPRALMGGNATMRTAEYLPPFAAEPRAGHQARIQRSVLTNYFRKTVSDMCGRVFKRPPVLGDDVPEQIRKWAENIDLTGRHLDVFAKDVFFDGLQSGIGFLLVDAPRAEDDIVTVAQEKLAGRRPYLIHVLLERVLGWKSATVAGVERLTQFRFKESVAAPDGEFHEKELDQIRVLEPGRWQTYRKNMASGRAAEWVLHEEGTTSLDIIPIVPFYANRSEFMSGEPPLADLAELNLAHFRSSSDQTNILHTARIPILVATGFEEKDVFEIGASSAVRTSNPNAKLAYVEHQGHAIAAGEANIKALEQQMQALGLQLLTPRQAATTATGEIRDDSKERSTLAQMARSLQDALEEAFGLLARYGGLGDNDAGGSVVINSDFGMPAGGDFASLLGAANSGQISRTTFLTEAKRRGILAEDLDIEVELNRLDAEETRRAPMDLDA